MRQPMAFCLSVLICLTAGAQTINLQGIVSNTGNQPIGNAVVTLVRQKMKDTTGIDGKYFFSGAITANLPAIVPQTEDISMHNGVLQFTLNNSSPVKVEIFDVKGNLLKKELLQNTAGGEYRFDIADNFNNPAGGLINGSIDKCLRMFVILGTFHAGIAVAKMEYTG